MTHKQLHGGIVELHLDVISIGGQTEVRQILEPGKSFWLPPDAPHSGRLIEGEPAIFYLPIETAKERGLL